MKNKCLLCKKTIVAIGTSRENGANHNDWNNRKYHKKCYKELQWIILKEKYERENN
tara:strand:- start:779 stop:946 length:168 start_codon:yes stop_codon:yes gene_type:complete